MVVWKLKGCPRCGGDVFIEPRVEEPYLECLQCSYTLELIKKTYVRQNPVSAGSDNMETPRSYETGAP